MDSKYVGRLRKLSKGYNDLLNLNIWCFNKLMLNNELGKEYQNEYHKYKPLTEYKKLLEECIEGL